MGPMTTAWAAVTIVLLFVNVLSICLLLSLFLLSPLYLKQEKPPVVSNIEYLTEMSTPITFSDYSIECTACIAGYI